MAISSVKMPVWQTGGEFDLSCMSGLWSTNIFSIVGWWGYNPWRDLIGVKFSIVGRWDYNPYGVPVLSFLHNY